MDFYAYQRLVGKIDDIPELRDEFIAIFNTKSKADIVRFCLALGQHLLDMTGFQPIDEITASFVAMQRWLDGKTNYHEARNLSLQISRVARAEEDPIKARFLRTMAQVAASPHVKYHGLWVTDFAVTLVNRIHPGDMDEVKKERQKHIELLRAV